MSTDSLFELIKTAFGSKDIILSFFPMEKYLTLNKPYF
ncbi:hypothetical protein CWATWH0402_2011 [Crocosphaera watsonii WH 0402]|uniref:Uncharacterized protein n=1 Tax=Crocosphaera watsonii WH 0402 TaxID=1284629 RepID=T2JJZ5_CROWT|nr:hypothetical protein CWATWH0402_2011 [Crocosphaera watsonii WH 0402]